MIESCRRLTAFGATATAATVIAVALAAPPPLARFIDAASTGDKIARAALAAIAAEWNDSYTPMIVDLARLMRPARRARMFNARHRRGDDHADICRRLSRGTWVRSLTTTARLTIVPRGVPVRRAPRRS